MNLAPRPPPWDRSRLGVVAGFYATLSVAAVLWHAVDQDSLDVWHTAPTPPQARALGALTGLALGAATVVAFRRLYPHMAWLQTLHREVRALLGAPSRAEVLVLAACSAIGEELFFRGAMMDAWGVLPATVIFALLHVPPRRSLWPWTASAFVMGLCFALLALWSGSLAGPVLAHFVVNWRNLGYIASTAPPAAPSDAAPAPTDA